MGLLGLLSLLSLLGLFSLLGLLRFLGLLSMLGWLGLLVLLTWLAWLVLLARLAFLAWLALLGWLAWRRLARPRGGEGRGIWLTAPGESAPHGSVQLMFAIWRRAVAPVVRGAHNFLDWRGLAWLIQVRALANRSEGSG